MLLPSANQTNASLMVLECGSAAVVLAAAFTWPRLGSQWFAALERSFGRLARRKHLAVFTVGASMLLLRLALLPLFPVPLPFVPDDFSFLLAGDTFAHGRLTNPTPELWTHFETLHETMAPTYQSMYFPGQGLLLAAGQVLFGVPWVGVLFSSALMCAALCWMLQAWLPPGWALLGGLIAVLRLGLFSYWTNTYHAAGSLAALSGALVLGALPRLVGSGRFLWSSGRRYGSGNLWYGLPIGAGIAILALTRPYEGLLLCVPVAVVLGGWAFTNPRRPGMAALARHAVLPLAVIAIACGWLGYYDLKAFGKATTPPYKVDRDTYAIAPYYVWQHARPEPHYRYAAMRNFYHKGELDFFNEIHSAAGFVPYSVEKVAFAFMFYANFLLLIPLIMVRRIFLDRRIRFLAVCVLVLAAGLSIEIFLLPHYIAPFAACFYAIGLQAMRHLRVWKPEGKPVGLALVRFTVLACVALAGVRAAAAPLGIAPSEWPASSWNFNWFGPQHFGTERAGIEAQLEKLPGGQLAIVRYSARHDPFDEWVYNSADIDQSKVIWARDMKPVGNRELLNHYRGRTAWLVEPDAIPARVTPYPETTEAATGN